MTSRGGAIARGSAAAALATAVALCSHVLAGGAVPHLLGVVVPFALAVPACTLLAQWRPALPRLGSSVAVSQLLFHTLFSLGAAPAAPGTSSTCVRPGTSASSGSPPRARPC